MTVLAAAAAAVAVLVAWPSPRWQLGVRLGRVPRPDRAALAAFAGAGAGLALVMLRPATVVLGLAAVGVAGVALHQVRAVGLRRARRKARSDTAEFVEVLAGYLRAGLLPADAAGAASADHPALARVGAAAQRHGDIPAVLHALARDPGRGALANVASAWLVAERSGAPLAAVLERVAKGIRETADALGDIETAVAPARATGLLMAALPALGFSLGSGLGADPIGVVTTNAVAAASVASGVGLAAVGVAWIDRLATRAEAGS